MSVVRKQNISDPLASILVCAVACVYVRTLKPILNGGGGGALMNFDKFEDLHLLIFPISELRQI